MKRLKNRQWKVEHNEAIKKKQQKKNADKAGKSISEINAKAQELGMSYGKYVSMMGL